MSDLFHPDVPDEFIVQVFDTMQLSVQHQFQILTKRPKRMAKLLNSPTFRERFGVLSNVWLGTSIENDRYAWRADRLRDTSAAIRFLSLEPLIGDVPSLDLTGIDWVIVGGESGHDARPMQLSWVRSLRTRARAVGTAFFVKQLGTEWSVSRGHGRTHGGDWELWPKDLKVRRYPEQLASLEKAV